MHIYIFKALYTWQFQVGHDNGHEFPTFYNLGLEKRVVCKLPLLLLSIFSTSTLQSTFVFLFSFLYCLPFYPLIALILISPVFVFWNAKLVFFGSLHFKLCDLWWHERNILKSNYELWKHGNWSTFDPDFWHMHSFVLLGFALFLYFLMYF